MHGWFLFFVLLGDWRQNLHNTYIHVCMYMYVCMFLYVVRVICLSLIAK
jgi:hypothetical protein